MNFLNFLGPLMRSKNIIFLSIVSLYVFIQSNQLSILKKENLKLRLESKQLIIKIKEMNDREINLATVISEYHITKQNQENESHALRNKLQNALKDNECANLAVPDDIIRLHVTSAGERLKKFNSNQLTRSMPSS